MEATLEIGGSLEHDGDELVRYTARLSNGNFVASTSAWGNVGDHLQLAETLQGFPVSADSTASYAFGTPGTGYCQLDLFCTDRLGHIGLWATFESTYPVSRTEQHETARLFMRCDPASIDSFVAELRSFVAGSTNRAKLIGLGP
jgi:hypothetical protein